MPQDKTHVIFKSLLRSFISEIKQPTLSENDVHWFKGDVETSLCDSKEQAMNSNSTDMQTSLYLFIFLIQKEYKSHE